MRGQIETIMEQGIEAARSGEKQRARDLFIHAIELDQRNERAWLWLSSVVDSQADKEICLENVLLINPDNTYAAMGLQHLRQQPRDPFAPPSVLPSLKGPKTVAEEEWGAPVEIRPPPAERVCSKCGFRNPGWAYVCDRCGANLRRVNLKEALRETKPRGRYFASLLDAWGGALIFNRLYAFQPELALASWGRSIAALIVGAILATGLRMFTTVIVPLLITGADYNLVNRLVTDALQWTKETMLLALLATLLWGVAAPLTWAGARLLGGKQGFKAHAHLVAVAVSAWNLLGAAFSAAIVLVPFLLANASPLQVPLERLFNTASIAVGIAGFVWLAHAVRTAHDLPAAKAMAVAVAGEALGAATLLALDLITSGKFTESMGALLVTYFLPWLKAV